MKEVGARKLKSAIKLLIEQGLAKSSVEALRLLVRGHVIDEVGNKIETRARYSPDLKLKLVAQENLMAKPKGMSRSDYNKLIQEANKGCSSKESTLNCCDRGHSAFDGKTNEKYCPACKARMILRVGYCKTGVPQGPARNLALPNRKYGT